MLPIYSPSPSGKNLVVNSRLKKLVWYSKIFYLGLLLIGSTFILSTMVVNEKVFKNGIVGRLSASLSGSSSDPCYMTKGHCSRGGGEALPRGIIVETTDLQLRSLVYDDEEKEVEEVKTKNLLAMAVGIKQKTSVDDIVQKFPLSDFTIMLFHYDGVVDEWNDLSWSNQSIHIVSLHQTKWWFAKRFMHPDIIAEYNYVFLWDEDLGVENFHADKYLEIMEEEGFEISQPALDPASQNVHHYITRRKPSGRAHTMFFANRTNMVCNNDSNGPPCTGYVEVMAPVFSKSAWRCIWYMIQNDLVHGWGIDLRIGYCAQGDRTKKVGVIDAEYVLHKGIPSLGGEAPQNTTLDGENGDSIAPPPEEGRNGNNDPHEEGKEKDKNDLRTQVRKQAGRELILFLTRWKNAVQEDPTWTEPYPPRNDSSAHYHEV